MVKRRKNLSSMLMVIVMSILTILCSITAFATEAEIPDPTSQFYVNDFANIIGDEVEREMVERAKAFSDATDGIQVVVTTVQNIGNADSIEYTVDMYNQYGIGKNSMGVLIMLSVETRDFQIRIGDSMTKYLSDSKSGKIVDDYGTPYFENNEFEEGLNQTQNAIIEHINSKVDTANNEVVITPVDPDDVGNNKGILGIILFCLLVIVGGIGSFFGISKYSKARKEKKAAEEIERIENSEIVQKKNQKIRSLEDELANDKATYNESISSKDRKINYLSSQLDSTKAELDNLMERYTRARIAYPDLDEKVDAIFAKEKEEADKAAASRVEICIENVLKHEITRTNLNKFNDTLNKFKNLTSEQKKYVPSELVSKLEKAYRESSRLQKEYEEAERVRRNKEKAAEVQNIILAVLAISATRHSLSQIKRALDAYNYLNSDQKKYVTADIDALNNALRRAKRDQEEYEEEEERRRRAEEERRRRQREEEERRRRASSYSSSSFGGSSFGSSSGFGGHSSGHGAGRKF